MPQLLPDVVNEYRSQHAEMWNRKVLEILPSSKQHGVECFLVCPSGLGPMRSAAREGPCTTSWIVQVLLRSKDDAFLVFSLERSFSSPSFSRILRWETTLPIMGVSTGVSDPDGTNNQQSEAR
jgi:hypothetical protein